MEKGQGRKIEAEIQFCQDESTRISTNQVEHVQEGQGEAFCITVCTNTSESMPSVKEEDEVQAAHGTQAIRGRQISEQNAI